MKTTRTIKVNSMEEARAELDRLFPTDYEKDEISSMRTGYPIYRHHSLNPEMYFSEIGGGFELNNVEGKGITTRIVVEEKLMKTKEEIENAIRITKGNITYLNW